ncbi:MAG: MFS transporter [Mycobacteriales bacterium]
METWGVSFAGDVARLARARLTGYGATESGLEATTELNLTSAACDAMVTVALASTLFFAVPTGQARGRVALYLLTTMVPFVLLAPIVGPLLDRFGRFRRVTLAATLVVRGVIAWTMAKHTGGIALYPLAFGILISSKAYGVAKSAVVPRVVPPGGSLVAVNSRLQLSSTIGSVIAAPIALGITHIPLFGYTGLLKIASLAYFATALVVLRMPAHVDKPRLPGERAAFVPLGVGSRQVFGNLPVALRRVLPVRALVGFLTFFLAFYFNSRHSNLSLGALAALVALGNILGLALGRASRRRRPEGIISIAQLVAAGAAIAATALFSVPAALALAGFVQLASVTAKLCLDAVIQRDVPDARRASAFGASETAYQLVWVLGGALGLIPFAGRIGFAAAAAAMVLLVLLSLRRAPPAPQVPQPGLAESP